MILYIILWLRFFNPYQILFWIRVLIQGVNDNIPHTITDFWQQNIVNNPLVPGEDFCIYFYFAFNKIW
jgi:hypothetical protein